VHDESNAFELAYVDSGERPTVLLVHGFPLNSGMWSDQIDRLSDFARVVAVDLRGLGRSAPVPGPCDVGTYADDCADLLDHLGVNTPVVVCGHSMGGYVALEFCRRHRGAVAGLVLVSTQAGADSPEARSKRDATVAQVKAEGISGLVDSMLPKLLAPANAKADPELVAALRELMEEASVDGVAAALQAMRDRPDSTPMLGQIDVPVLVVHGNQDELIGVSAAEAMHAAISGSRLVLLEGAGHMPNLEQPDAFDEALIEFLVELEARTRTGSD
jgi:3-oxoadipate enol-lactonase